MTPRATPMAPDDRRQAIVDAVIPLLVSQGSAVTTRQIAEAAGVAEGTIFRVFPDKCALMHAAARAVFDPDRGRRRLAATDPDLDLRGMVRAVAEEMLASMERVMAVLIAVRGVLSRAGETGAGETGLGDDGPPAGRTGPPEFILEANRALLEGLTELFGRYRDELALPPDRAALVLRGLVFGSRHPGMDDVQPLDADEIATAVLTGVTGTGEPR